MSSMAYLTVPGSLLQILKNPVASFIMTTPVMKTEEMFLILSYQDLIDQLTKVNAHLVNLVDSQHSSEAGLHQEISDFPSNLLLSYRNETTVLLSWQPPAQVGYLGFQIKINCLNFSQSRLFNLGKNDRQFAIDSLTAGATYKVQAFTPFRNAKGLNFTSFFTTKPLIEGKFGSLYSQERSLSVAWIPTCFDCYYTRYKITIQPQDTAYHTLYLKKPNKWKKTYITFLDLVPGRLYNISVQTMAQDQISKPITGQFRTKPSPPSKIWFPYDSIESSSFIVEWKEPGGKTEFNYYRIYLTEGDEALNQAREEPTSMKFKNLYPGKTYTVNIETISGVVASSLISANVTSRPLPVTDLHHKMENGTVDISWTPSTDSFQDKYLVLYYDTRKINRTNFTLETTETRATLTNLSHGGNYLIVVHAISKDMKSKAEFLTVDVPQPA